MSKVVYVRIEYEIIIPHCEGDMDELRENIHDRICRSDRLNLYLKNYSIGLEDDNIIVNGELENDDIYLIDPKLDYSKICNVCNNLYALKELTMCAECYQQTKTITIAQALEILSNISCEISDFVVYDDGTKQIEYKLVLKSVEVNKNNLG